MYALRDYQQTAVNRTIAHFKKSLDPALIVLPTGSGKSLVIAELARLAKGRVLVLAHVKELVEQNHAKYASYELTGGIYSAGLAQKQLDQKVTFGSIQSVARAPDALFASISLVIIDECHRVNMEDATQYAEVIEKLKKANPKLCILGLTATPYRLGKGWIYRYGENGDRKGGEDCFFQRCVFELPLANMIKRGYLTRPVKIDIPVTSYDFSELSEQGRMYTREDVENILIKQRKLTPLIVKNIQDIAQRYDRKGVMIFSGSVRHAQEILSYLPADEAALIVGDTPSMERDALIEQFKAQKYRYLVNVSVLTTGFDAPHVDVIAILRPTESIGLYQQIIGRGLRLAPGKEDCFILDYTGMQMDIYQPQIQDKKPRKDTEVVAVDCPKCGFTNHFWGYADADGQVIEHFGRSCRGGDFDEVSYQVIPCTYRFRFKICDACGGENDISARACGLCQHVLIDAEAKLKQAKLSKASHVFVPDSFEMLTRKDRKQQTYLEIRYYDLDANYLSEAYYFSSPTSVKRFDINFLRSHLKRPEKHYQIKTIEGALALKKHYRLPAFMIARKQDKYWKITEKIFAEAFM